MRQNRRAPSPVRKTDRGLLLQLHHAQVPLGLIVMERLREGDKET